MAKQHLEDLVINSILGPGGSFVGTIEVPGFIRVDGRLRGNLSARGRVVIGEDAKLESDIVGSTVIIGGVVKGNVYASDSVTVLGTGLVIGDIITRRIQADPGNIIHGRIIACGPDADWEARLSAYKDERGVRRAAGQALPGNG